MARINAILEEEVDYGFEGGPRYKTSLIELQNGLEDRDSEWAYPKHEYRASFGNIKDIDRDTIIEVFHACRGRRHSFMFKDWNDYKIENQIIQVSPGTSDTIQIYKIYEFGPVYAVRPIQALKTAQIRNSLNEVVGGTFNLLTGEFTPDEEWDYGTYRLDCEFYVWVRFDNDYNSMKINSWEANSANVELIEDKFSFTSTNVPDSWEE